MTSGSFFANNEEILEVAGRLDAIGMGYGCPAVSGAGTGADVTGHVELAGVLPQFCDFTTEVLNALIGNLAAHAEALRASAQLYCTADDSSGTALRSLSLPSFNPHVDTQQ